MEDYYLTEDAIAKADGERAEAARSKAAAEAAARARETASPPLSSPDFRRAEEAENPTLDVPPPVPHYLATDPSIGKTREVFGHQLGTEQQLRTRLSPGGLLPADQKDLSACMIDPTAAPGMFNKLDSDATTNVEEFTAAIKELSDGRSDQRNSAIQVDTQWRSISRNALRRALVSEEALQELYDTVERLQREVLGNMNTVMETVFEKYYWEDDIKQYWAQGNLFFRIASDTQANFIALLTEHLRIARLYGWDYARKALEHHSKKLTEIRGTALSRLNALVSIYVYLRDSRVNHFNSPALQEKRNIYLFNEIARLEQCVSIATSPKCPKCGGDGRVHAPGKANCPFKNLKDVEARKRAAAVELAHQQEPGREE